MKIVTVCRTKNEAANIGRFCHCYGWADTVLIADGGSDDDTVRIAQTFPNVVVEPFLERVEKNDHWRNPHGKHMNFMFNWAKEAGADWIIFDDCDCVPTVDLQRSAREILEATDRTVTMLYRLYIWGGSQYFPRQNVPGQSLWAWRTSEPIRALDNDWSHDIVGIPGEPHVLRLETPLAALHYFCPDPETTERKLTFYRESEQQPWALHPLEGCGPLEQLPEWARWRNDNDCTTTFACGYRGPDRLFRNGQSQSTGDRQDKLLRGPGRVSAPGSGPSSQPVAIGGGVMAKKKDVKKNWPPEREESGWERDDNDLVKTLLGLPGMSQELAQRMVEDGNWPADAGELARRYGMSQMDAEAVLKVLNANRGKVSGFNV